ncbi:TetR family transcriptional regulator [Paenibacillus mucilaginosus 3016]|uniref:TetR family transcriptional regulator n=2 Tax=Paenibacillus mucilaginosus TaxID=61624 RepID=H6NI54_9BACL|nr:TetR/AcrR family transcriptional regulator [Paenibacillus mucilaginosus]AFC30825.1 TetR family transcriptional regulator [Paenibacillus mucilaginosus 3016]AFH63147.1 TetR family transcriptional regulator [Paenibacillus mucilaginosus K02]WFA19430.1 TetR/AcrR family transcriptional regulator [Paenibacillus mucilaginosus]
MTNRRQALLDTALSLFLEHGFANTTIQMILDASGVSKGTFYKWFESKNDCVVAIFEQLLQEDLLLRKELESSGGYASDFDLLVDQIAIPMSLPEKQRVTELFWAWFYSGEFHLTDLARMQLKWLSERLVQLYGEEIRPYAYEGAILCHGMLHQIANTWRNLHGRGQPVWREAVPRVLTYVEVLLRAMQERGEHIMDLQTLSLIGYQEQDEIPDKQSLIDELRELDRAVQKSKEPAKTRELTKGLLMVLQQEETNRSLLEAVLQAFLAQLEESAFRAEARRAAQAVWWYLEKLKPE